MMGLLDTLLPADTVRFVAYDPRTGAITTAGSTSAVAYQELASRPGYLLGNAEVGKHFIDLGSLSVRPKTSSPHTMTLSGDTVVLANLAAATSVSLFVVTGDAPSAVMAQGRWEVTDGALELTLVQPGTYRVVVEAAPFWRTEHQFIINPRA